MTETSMTNQAKILLLEEKYGYVLQQFSPLRDVLMAHTCGSLEEALAWLRTIEEHLMEYHVEVVQVLQAVRGEE